MKKIILFLALFTIVSLACDLAVTIAPPTSPALYPSSTIAPNLEYPTQIPIPIPPSR